MRTLKMPPCDGSPLHAAARNFMTEQEAGQRYGIPAHILDEYESWGLCPAVKRVMGAWQYDETDMERLSLILTLHDIGFAPAEVENYMRLVLEGGSTKAQRMLLLGEKRQGMLDEIHFREKQLDRLDYLRFEIRKKQDE